jgi:hypothetical protein
MIPLKYGTKEILIGVHDPYPFQCPNCKEINTVDFAITCEYFHIWYVPMFPTEKDGMATCRNCEFRVSSLKLSKRTEHLFKEIKKKYRYPFYTYIGISIILSPFIIAFLLMIFNK